MNCKLVALRDEAFCRQPDVGLVCLGTHKVVRKCI